ncbi:hypothetical protein EON67_00390 [archaeon]|nr:MAG: hypothetical protein EON67_00390 [archaeon]
MGTAILYAVIGVTLSLASNVTLASCVVFETKALETKSFSPTEVNGLKSALGAVLIIVSLAAFQVLPIQRDHGVFENSVHTVCCMATTPLLLALTLVVAASASLSSINAMYLSLLRGSNFRALIYVGRALFVWILQLLVYYLGYARRDAISMAYGESWGVYSWAELAGFATMVLGGGITWRAKSRRM